MRDRSSIGRMDRRVWLEANKLVLMLYLGFLGMQPCADILTSTCGMAVIYMYPP